jgi:hypothetical protein
MTDRRPPMGIAPADGRQIIRLNAYEEAHPGASITYDHVFGYWRAIIKEDGGETTVVRYELELLLDKLDTLDGPVPDSPVP